MLLTALTARGGIGTCHSFGWGKALPPHRHRHRHRQSWVGWKALPPHRHRHRQSWVGWKALGVFEAVG